MRFRYIAGGIGTSVGERKTTKNRYLTSTRSRNRSAVQRRPLMCGGTRQLLYPDQKPSLLGAGKRFKSIEGRLCWHLCGHREFSCPYPVCLITSLISPGYKRPGTWKKVGEKFPAGGVLRRLHPAPPGTAKPCPP